MMISGFQPLTLLDYPGLISSIVFTQGCPFRCAYCHNPDLVPTQASHPEQTVSTETVLNHLRTHKRMIEGLCITGGEPTMQPDLPDFIKQVRRLGMRVKLDTNGVHPRMIEQLIQEQLVDYFAMDLKHTWEHYANVIGVHQEQVLRNCQETFKLIQASGVPHEFRTTVYSGFHSSEDLIRIASQLKNGERYALQEIRYGTTLDPHLAQTPPLNLETTADAVRHAFPLLQVEVRA